MPILFFVRNILQFGPGAWASAHIFQFKLNERNATIVLYMRSFCLRGPRKPRTGAAVGATHCRIPFTTANKRRTSRAKASRSVKWNFPMSRPLTPLGTFPRRTHADTPFSHPPL
uniref:Uncharacterized protein n=1 Tax=Schistocephalus solidus TaxID=70667 RepID=A0A0X3P5E3_SCHSO